MPDVINITNAKQIGDYQIFLRFDDESEQVINFKPFLSRSRHPAIREWLDLAKFHLQSTSTLSLSAMMMLMP